MLQLPVIIKVLGSLALILLSHGLLRNLLASVIIGAAVLAAWCGYGPAGALAVAWERFSSFDNLMLAVVILQVIWLSTQMSRAGVMHDLVEAVRLRTSSRVSMAALPAVIGLLPMPGGAIFSAPLVEECDPSGQVRPLVKVQTNYWFRHVWEYWWPLYPGVLLALDITGLDVWQFVLAQLPFSLVALFAGYFFLLRKVDGTGNAPRRGEKKSLLPLVAPIIVVVITYAAVKLFLPNIVRANKYIPLLLGIWAAMLFVQIRRPLSGRQWRSVLLSRKSLNLVVLVAAVQIYGAFIEGRLPDGTLLVSTMRLELSELGIPAMAMIMVLPFVAGLTTGLTIGFVGASFPIVISLLGDDPAPGAFIGSVSLAYICGFAGMILSPVHLCLIVTNEHFGTRLPVSLVGLVKPTAVVVLAAVAAYFAWMRI